MNCDPSTYEVKNFFHDINQFEAKIILTNSNVQTIILNTYTVVYSFANRNYVEKIDAQSPYKALKIFINSISPARKKYIQIIKIV